MAAALLGGVPGVSKVFCGSAVTYREATKLSWLQVPEETLQRYTAESPETTRALATQVLRHTPEATLAAAVTGHLGPDAKQELDGLVHFGVLLRRPVDAAADPDSPEVEADVSYVAATVRLQKNQRGERQVESAARLLQFVGSVLANQNGPINVCDD